MNTKNVPALIVLSAGLVDCIVSIYYGLEFGAFIKRLLFVLVIFYILGIGVKILFDKFFPIMSEEEMETEEELLDNEDETLENIETGGEEVDGFEGFDSNEGQAS